ncbi:protease modulator HflC, partial [Proteus mirabilis]|nr:protease modulator HflC [Proteus mirabilis]
QAETLLRRKFSDLLRSEIARMSVNQIITDSRGRLNIDVRNALNEGTTSRDKSDADDAISIAAKKVAEVTKGKAPALNMN